MSGRRGEWEGVSRRSVPGLEGQSAGRGRTGCLCGQRTVSRVEGKRREREAYGDEAAMHRREDRRCEGKVDVSLRER